MVVLFEAAAPGFERLVGSHVARVLARSHLELFHEAGVWIPRSSEWLVTSNRLGAGTHEEHVRISAIHYPSGEVRRLPHLEQDIIMGNGGTTDFNGGAFLLSQGMHAKGGSVWHIDPKLTTCKALGPPADVTLNSPNDIVLHRQSGRLLFTDPAYGIESQGFRTTFHNVKAVWSAKPGSPRKSDWLMINAGCHDQPNGILLSPDEQTMYVTDVWHPDWHTNPDVRIARANGKCLRPEGPARRVYKSRLAYGDEGALTVSSSGLFFDLADGKSGDEAQSGYPDGIKCDVHGNVYAGCGDGVRVYSPEGRFLGRLRVKGGVSNLVFGGTDGRALLMLNEQRAIVAQMAVAGALSPYASGTQSVPSE